MYKTKRLDNIDIGESRLSSPNISNEFDSLVTGHGNADTTILVSNILKKPKILY